MSDGARSTDDHVVYCHCAYAKVVRPDVKAAVLRDLGESGRDFDAVPDLCEMAARKDPALARIAEQEGLRIVACFPRAVEWLFHAGGTPLPKGTPILNMREQSPEEIAAALAEPFTASVPEDEAPAEEVPS